MFKNILLISLNHGVTYLALQIPMAIPTNQLIYQLLKKYNSPGLKGLMDKKQGSEKQPAQRMLQTFFSIDGHTGQPIGFEIAAPGDNITKATLGLLNLIGSVEGLNSLVSADKEYVTTGYKGGRQRRNSLAGRQGVS